MDLMGFVASTPTERKRTKKKISKARIPQDPTRWLEGNGESVAMVEWKGHPENGAEHMKDDTGLDDDSMETSRRSNSNGRKNELEWINSYETYQQMVSDEFQSLCMDAIQKHKLSNHEYSDWVPRQESNGDWQRTTTTKTERSGRECNNEDLSQLTELQMKLRAAEDDRRLAQALEHKWKLQSMVYERRCKDLEQRNDSLKDQLSNPPANLSDGRNVDEMRDIIQELVLELERIEHANRRLEMERDEALEREAVLLERESRLVERESRLMEILNSVSETNQDTDAGEKHPVTPQSVDSPPTAPKPRDGKAAPTSTENVLVKKTNQYEKGAIPGHDKNGTTGAVGNSQMALSLDLILALTNMTKANGDDDAVEDHICDLLTRLGESLSRNDDPHETTDNSRPNLDFQTMVWSPGTSSARMGDRNGASRKGRRRRRPRNHSGAVVALAAMPNQYGLQRGSSEPVTATEKDDVALWIEEFRKLLQHGDNLADGVMAEVRNLGRHSTNGESLTASFISPVTHDSSCALVKRKRELDVAETDLKLMKVSAPTTTTAQDSRWDEMMTNMLELLQKTKEADALTMEAVVATVRREAADEICRLETQHEEQLEVICTQYVQLKVLCRWQRFVYRRRVAREANSSSGALSEFTDCVGYEQELD